MGSRFAAPGKEGHRSCSSFDQTRRGGQLRGNHQNWQETESLTERFGESSFFKASDSEMSSVVWKTRMSRLFLLQTFIMIANVHSLRKVKLGGKDCTFKGERICNGAVTKEIGSLTVQICVNGKVRLMPRMKVGEGFALLGRDTGPGKDCLWYGTTFCDGDLVEDLFRWWFRMKCSKSKFTVASVPYTQVVQDPRFKP